MLAHAKPKKHGPPPAPTDATLVLYDTTNTYGIQHDGANGFTWVSGASL